MANYPCRTCQEEVPDKAIRCPHCHTAFPSMGPLVACRGCGGEVRKKALTCEACGLAKPGGGVTGQLVLQPIEAQA